MGQDTSKSASFVATGARTGGGGRVGEIAAPSLVGAISSATTTIHKQPPRVFKPVIKGRVGGQVIATLIEAVAEIEATVLAPALDLLIKYFGNIVDNPHEPKYRRIKKTNKLFVERMSPIVGVETVFETLGFVVQHASALPDAAPSASPDDVYFVFPPEANISFLDTAREMFSEFHALIAAEAVEESKPVPTVEQRGTRIFRVPMTSDASRLPSFPEVPESFFELTEQELRMLQEGLRQKAEGNQQLTPQHLIKKPPPRVYAQTIIRIRMPGYLIAQGAFRPQEPLYRIVDWVRSLILPMSPPFLLCPPVSKMVLEAGSSLQELGLVPAVMLTMRWLDGDTQRHADVSEAFAQKLEDFASVAVPIPRPLDSNGREIDISAASGGAFGGGGGEAKSSSGTAGGDGSAMKVPKWLQLSKK